MTTEKYPVVTAPVLIPNTPDCEYRYGEEILPSSKINYLANSFNNYKIIDLQHEYTQRIIDGKTPIQRGEVIKSYITSNPVTLLGMDKILRKYPSGTWILSVRIIDPHAIQLYKEGKINGFSVTTKNKEYADILKNYSTKSNSNLPKRILMKDVKNPVAFTVSLVNKPCVYGAKFCKKSCLIKNKDKLMEKDTMSMKDKIKSTLHGLIDDIDIDDLEESVKEDISKNNDINEDIIKSSDKSNCSNKNNNSESEENKKEDKQQVKEGNDKQSKKVVTESKKEYITMDTATNIIQESLHNYSEEISTLISDTINSTLQEAQKQEINNEQQEKNIEYATEDMVKEIFNNQFESFKSELVENLKTIQQESLKSYSKSIENNIGDGFNKEANKEEGINNSYANRDAFGRKIKRN